MLASAGTGAAVGAFCHEVEVGWRGGGAEGSGEWCRGKKRNRGSASKYRDGNSTHGCGYPRILNPMDAGAGLIFHPWVDPHPHPHIAGAGADLRFHPRVDPHPSGKKKPQPNLLR